MAEVGARKRRVELNGTLAPVDPQKGEAETDSSGNDSDEARFRAKLLR
ncbi:hypothetical protein [Halobellus marinus]|nr:hypothetical protein [Halobellus sp. DFY28]